MHLCSTEYACTCLTVWSHHHPITHTHNDWQAFQPVPSLHPPRQSSKHLHPPYKGTPPNPALPCLSHNIALRMKSHSNNSMSGAEGGEADGKSRQLHFPSGTRPPHRTNLLCSGKPNQHCIDLMVGLLPPRFFGTACQELGALMCQRRLEKREEKKLK